jgi:hypothetical protein
MARRTQTYAIRRAVEGGGQAKAELVSVGQSGEQSLTRIESAGPRPPGRAAAHRHPHPRWRAGRAALEAAPVIADLSSWLADVAGKAGIAWDRLFDAPEAKSLRTLRCELDLASSTIEKLEGRIQELQESPTLRLHHLPRHRPPTSARHASREHPAAPSGRRAALQR